MGNATTVVVVPSSGMSFQLGARFRLMVRNCSTAKHVGGCLILCAHVTMANTTKTDLPRGIDWRQESAQEDRDAQPFAAADLMRLSSPASAGGCAQSVGLHMNIDDPRAKWHQLDPAALRALTEPSANPGVVYPVGTNALPVQIRQMPGVVAFFASSHITPTPMANSATAGAEFVVVRSAGELHKAYNYVVATSSDGKVYFNGPHYNFPGHHFASTAPVPVEALFSHVPLSPKSKA